jgi:hydroxymethylglutaryl-CoA reductase
MQKEAVEFLISHLKIKQFTNYYQLHATFETKDSMGPSICLEQFAKTLKAEALGYSSFLRPKKKFR